jgi:c-di-GMP-binding flagellar brake protein YcgR
MVETGEVSAWANIGADRRQAERKVFRALAELRLPDQQVLGVRTFDISVGGIGVVSPLNLRLESFCHVKVRAPLLGMGMDVLKLHARVVHSVLSAKESGFMLGLEFADPPPAAVSLIKQFITTASWMR